MRLSEDGRPGKPRFRNPLSARAGKSVGCVKRTFRNMRGAFHAPYLLPLVSVATLEDRVLFVAASGEVGHEVENFVAGQLVQQTFRHDRDFRLDPLINVGRLDDCRLSGQERVFDDLHLVFGFFEDQARDLLAAVEDERPRLVLLVDLGRRVEHVAQDIRRLLLRVEARVFVGTVFAELQSVRFNEEKPSPNA